MCRSVPNLCGAACTTARPASSYVPGEIDFAKIEADDHPKDNCV